MGLEMNNCPLCSIELLERDLVIKLTLGCVIYGKIDWLHSNDSASQNVVYHLDCIKCSLEWISEK